MTRWRCHLSICACRSSRRASRSWFWGSRSVTTLSTPAQKRVGIDIGARQRLVVDEVVQHLGDAQVAHRHAIGHFSSLSRRCCVSAVTVDPAYPPVTAAIRRAARVSSRSHRSASAGPQRRGAFGDVLLGPDVFGAARRRFDRRSARIRSRADHRGSPACPAHGRRRPAPGSPSPAPSRPAAPA